MHLCQLAKRKLHTGGAHEDLADSRREANYVRFFALLIGFPFSFADIRYTLYIHTYIMINRSLTQCKSVYVKLRIARKSVTNGAKRTDK